MSLKESLKNESRQEKEKLKKMTWSDRIWYIWEYYKLHMLGLAGVILVFYIIGTIFYNKSFTSQLSYVVVNDPQRAVADYEPLNQDFKEHMGYGEKDTINADGSMSMQQGGGFASEMDYANMAKLSAQVASKELDMMIADQSNIDHYASLDGFLDLEQALPADLLQELQDSVYYAKDESGNEFACAINLSDSRFPEETGNGLDPCYMGIINNTEHIDTIIAWIRFVWNPA